MVEYTRYVDGIKIGDVVDLSTNIVTVEGNGYGDFDTLGDAVSSITDSADDNRYLIKVYGDIVEPEGTISFPSYVNLIGFGARVFGSSTASANIIYLYNGNNTVRDIEFIRTGTNERTSAVVGVNGSDTSLTNVIARSLVTASTHRTMGLSVGGSNCSYTNVVGIASETGCGPGISIGQNDAVFTNCIATGSSRKYDSQYNSGFYLQNCDCVPTLVNCVGISGNSNDGAGIVIANSAVPRIVGGRYLPYPTDGSSGLWVQTTNSSFTATGCVFDIPKFNGSFKYTGSETQTLPVAGSPYYLSTIRILVSVAGVPGSTIDIGSTPAGSEIATVDSSTTGVKHVSVLSFEQIASDLPVYITVSDTNCRFTMSYEGVYNFVTYGILLSDIGYPKFSNCNILGTAAGKALYLTDNSTNVQGYSFDNCTIMSDVATGDAIYCAGAMNRPIIRNCSVVGLLTNCVISNEITGTAATIDAGNTYVDVTHGLATTPTTVRVTPTTNLGTRSFWVDTKGASTFRININSSDSIDHTFDWEAEV